MLKKKGAHVVVLIVTDGSSTQYADDSEILEAKHAEARAAAKVVGADELVLWKYPDMRLDTVAHADLNKDMESFVQDHAFDTVFTHFAGDINLDHQEVTRSVTVACRPHPHQTVRNVLTYWVNSSSEWGQIMNRQPFRPNIFVDIEDTIDTKLAAMQEYATELRDYPHPRSIESLRHRALVCGSEVGLRYAEPFMSLLHRI